MDRCCLSSTFSRVRLTKHPSRIGTERDSTAWQAHRQAWSKSKNFRTNVSPGPTTSATYLSASLTGRRLDKNASVLSSRLARSTNGIGFDEECEIQMLRMCKPRGDAFRHSENLFRLWCLAGAAGLGVGMRSYSKNVTPAAVHAETALAVRCASIASLQPIFCRTLASVGGYSWLPKENISRDMHAERCWWKML